MSCVQSVRSLLTALLRAPARLPARSPARTQARTPGAAAPRLPASPTAPPPPACSPSLPQAALPPGGDHAGRPLAGESFENHWRGAYEVRPLERESRQAHSQVGGWTGRGCVGGPGKGVLLSRCKPAHLTR